ncbi:MAG: hypothetical protein GF411_04120 [Candidatus Lokiarchaeota archaeon]|nr:hypothetical protein [Candidatus Lokiarchaeota archaeon]
MKNVFTCILVVTLCCMIYHIPICDFDSQTNSNRIPDKNCLTDLEVVEKTSPSSGIWTLEYLNGYYYVLGSDGRWRSNNLESWTALTGISGTADGTGIYAENIYVLSAGDMLFWSDNGVDFWDVYTGDCESFQTIIHFDGVFYAFGYNPAKIIRSEDGISWFEVSTTGYSFHQGFLGHAATVYGEWIYACEYQGYVIRSNDGIEWAQVHTYLSGAYATRSICTMDSRVFVIGATVVHYTDTTGANWQTKSLNVDPNTYLIKPEIFANSIFICAGRSTGTSYQNARIYQLRTNDYSLESITSFNAEIANGLVSDSTGLVASTDYGDIFDITIENDITTTSSTTTTTTTMTNTTHSQILIPAEIGFFFGLFGMVIVVGLSAIVLIRRRKRYSM